VIRRRVRVAVVTAALLAAGCVSAGSAPEIRGAKLVPLAFSDLPGWGADDHGAALATFRRSCAAIVADTPELRSAQPPDPRLVLACREALALPDEAAAQTFFESGFRAFEVRPDSGKTLLTGYFEPEYEGSLTPTDIFSTPLLERPDDLVTLEPGQAFPGLDPTLQAARRSEEGLRPYPDRAAIETGALGDRARPIVYLRPAEAFIIHVQGSARILLSEGGTLRVAYAGRNGQPYSSIGRLIVERGHVPLAEMSLERMLAWLGKHPAEGREIMRSNRSYIFFRRADELDPADGPIGGAGIPLTPGRSLAIDRNLWSYGLPVWLEGKLPLPKGGSEPLRRLMVAQDTGSAILGPARGDFFFGTGAPAGALAGLMRYPVRFVVLWPRAEADR
jgi:membrane-bound lytic murein transglycosylase A